MINRMRGDVVGTGSREGRAARWCVRIAACLALCSSVISGALIWLTLSHPVEVAGALAGEDAWRVARAIVSLLAGIAITLAAWL